MQVVNYLIHCTLRMKTKIKNIKHQKISAVGNLERTKDGTNKMRVMSKKPNWCRGKPISPRTIGQT